MQNTTERKDVYSRITAQIVEYLEWGVRLWIRPWKRGARRRTDYPSPAVHRFPKKCHLSQVTNRASRSKVSRIGRMEVP